MYYPNDIEEICYDDDHIQQVLAEIKANFYDYFEKFLETEAGNKITRIEFDKLSSEFGCTNIRITKKKINKAKVLKQIIDESIEMFERDRQKYLDILNEETLEEYEDDPSNFKNSVLRNECPIIRLTLQNKKAKELDKYRYEFRCSEPNELLKVVKNLVSFANKYMKNIYDEDKYESITKFKELKLSELDTEDYTVFGVIGGGIKSHFLYKLYPAVFSNRSREAIWALWYLTNKKTFNCTQDSEFLMINLKDNTTQQNYFYPYELFSFYVYNIYLLLKKEAERLGVYIDKEYRYVLVDSFLSFVAQEHANEIDELKRKVKDDIHGYY
ncbi:hypothetical protein [Caloranaerobacter azorensis]|uniref:Uncharacterized protein n=1 Tax=Caloranaerobacter azorensis TaxID=116090 RepID=A0A6P1YDM1_9FIRM|nr:hypothetical protein [Caloranaerobacter azorensis]QIB26843.1 hypothetical protein G3A45_05750 [Caloranaerobacter azorensis]